MANMASSIPAYMPAYGPLSCIYVPLQCGGSTEEESLGSTSVSTRRHNMVHYGRRGRVEEVRGSSGLSMAQYGRVEEVLGRRPLTPRQLSALVSFLPLPDQSRPDRHHQHLFAWTAALYHRSATNIFTQPNPKKSQNL